MDKSIISEYENIKKQYQESIVQKFTKQNLFEYNEILFSAHSCAIEGNSFSVNDTRELKEHGIKLKLQNKSMFEAFEILDHFKAFEFLMNYLSKPLNEQLLIDTQKLLTENTILYSKGYKPGAYTDTQMAAGDTVFGDHKESIKSIPSLMEATQAALEKETLHPIEISAKFHHFFIYLHPFPDGNGRVGRLMSNYILAKKEHPLIVITKDKKEAYIEALKLTQKHNDMDIISAFFFKTAMARMQNELKQMDENIIQTTKIKGRGMSFTF